jgi:hypothetical protein
MHGDLQWWCHCEERSDDAIPITSRADDSMEIA